MRLCRLLAPLLLTFSISFASHARAEQADAPFGLAWGKSVAEIKALDVVLEPIEKTEHGVNFRASNLPKRISDLGHVVLSFGFQDRLYRVAAVSEEFENDPYGASVKSRYKSLKSILEKKYGSGQTNHQRSDLWNEPDEFLMGLKTGRAWHYTNYRTENVSIQLGIRAISSSSAVYIIIYEENSIKKEVLKQEKANEEDAL